jgi:hypothetical protein
VTRTPTSSFHRRAIRSLELKLSAFAFRALCDVNARNTKSAPARPMEFGQVSTAREKSPTDGLVD